MDDLIIGIDYDDYFNQEAELQIVTKSKSDFSPDNVSEEIIKIKVRISGGDRFYRDKDSQLNVAEQVYKTKYPVKTKNILNGQTVVFVKTVYEFDGTVAYYKVYV